MCKSSADRDGSLTVPCVIQRPSQSSRLFCLSRSLISHPLHLCSSQLHSSVHDTQASHLGLLYSFLFYLTPDYVFTLQPNIFLALNTFLSPETVQICRLLIENTSMQLYKKQQHCFFSVLDNIYLKICILGWKNLLSG